MECRFSSSSIERSDVSNPRRAHFLLVRRRLDVLRLWRRERSSGAVRSSRESYRLVWEPAMGQILVAPNAIAAQYCFDLQVPLLELSFTELQVRAVQRVAVELNRAPTCVP